MLRPVLEGNDSFCLKLLIALHVWATLEQYEVLGMFGGFS